MTQDRETEDRSDRFLITGPEGIVVTQCTLCAHVGGGELWVCKAFPGQIPPEIVSNRVDHSHPFEGDDGVRFTPRADADPTLVKNLRAHFATR